MFGHKPKNGYFEVNVYKDNERPPIQYDLVVSPTVEYGKCAGDRIRENVFTNFPDASNYILNTISKREFRKRERNHWLGNLAMGSLNAQLHLINFNSDYETLYEK